MKIFGQCEIDLFAARHNTQLRRFFSLRPDPKAEAFNALAQPWKQMVPYAFPPFILIGRTLQKMRDERLPEMVLIAPLWLSQPWFPQLLEMVADYPILLPQTPSLITNPKGEPHPLALQNTLNLVAWGVSRIQSHTETFRKTLLHSSAQHGGKAQRRVTAQHGIIGSAGVLNRDRDPINPTIGHVLQFLYYITIHFRLLMPSDWPATLGVPSSTGCF